MAETSLVKACERLESGDDTLRNLELYEVDARLVHALSRPSCLRSLTLEYVELDRDLADALAKQTQLTQLLLDNVRLGDGAASHLAATLRQMTRLEEVEVYVREVSENDVKCVLAAVGELPQLQKLELHGRALAGRMRAVAEAVVAQGRLRELDVSLNQIGDDGAAHLAAMLEYNRSLSVLNVKWCSVGDAGLERLGRALPCNTTLRELDLRLNPFTAEGIARFADLMGDMRRLRKLELNGKWEQQLLPGIERNYSLLELNPAYPAAQPFLERNARGDAKARAATLAWLCCCRFSPPIGITRDIALIIARIVYASRGWSCWADNG
jgi:Ran GTPase-activating protein (RanGAP) involved in mRNA processing and transport